MKIFINLSDYLNNQHDNTRFLTLFKERLKRVRLQLLRFYIKYEKHELHKVYFNI